MMHIDVEKLSLEELLKLNRCVVRRIDYLHGLKTRKAWRLWVSGEL